MRLEIFQEALVQSGLLEAMILSLILLRSGRSLGDALGELSINYLSTHYLLLPGSGAS